MKNQEIIEQALRRVYDKNGGELTAEGVVTAAKSVRHPLHPFFEWDDTVAGHQYRLQQAHQLICSVTISITNADEVVSVRSWHAARRTGSPFPGYQPEDRLTNIQRGQVLRSMAREISAMRRRYGHLKEFWLELRKLVDDGDSAAVG